MPKNFHRNRLISIPQRAETNEWEDYRTKSLSSHASIPARPMNRRIQYKMEEKM
mgnify:CR=1 FL=1